MGIQFDTALGGSGARNEAEQARVVALSLAHCSSMAKLLRANRQEELAAGVEAAIGATMGLVAAELGRETLAKAINWARQELHAEIELPDLSVYNN